MLRLKTLREERNLSQLEVAKGIDTSQRNIGRWESGSNEPSSSFVIKLANFFNCTADYLLGREDDFGFITSASNSELSHQEERLIQIYRTLSDRDKKMIDNIFNSFVSDVPSKNVRA